MHGVLVLNASYEPIHRVSVKHAIRMLVREIAVVEEADEGAQFGPYPVPRVLRLVRYVYLKFRSKTPKWSRRRLLDRDRHSCRYCGKPATTVDHLTPRSRGGESSWTNTVAACHRCNSKKGNLTLHEAGLRLTAHPHVPTWEQVGLTHRRRADKS